MADDSLWDVTMTSYDRMVETGNVDPVDERNFELNTKVMTVHRVASLQTRLYTGQASGQFSQACSPKTKPCDLLTHQGSSTQRWAFCINVAVWISFISNSAMDFALLVLSF